MYRCRSLFGITGATKVVSGYSVVYNQFQCFLGYILFA